MNEWTLVSAHRTQRPWLGHLDQPGPAALPEYDPSCYLCPGNARASGERNPHYDHTFVFTNDYPALLPDTPGPSRGGPFTRHQPVSGTSRVICYSPRHDLALSDMSVDEVGEVVDLWAEQTRTLERGYEWVQVFENRGASMGASNPHPHGQIWASSVLPTIPASELAAQTAWWRANAEPLLTSYAAFEEAEGERTVLAAGIWRALVPYWAVWPFEVMVVPMSPIRRLPDVEDRVRTDLAVLLRDLLVLYDRLFDTPFPYSMGWHGAPGDGGDHPEWVLHAHFYPPLLRSAAVRKFMVGYEMLAEAQRDITPEDAAMRLREAGAGD